MIEISTWCPQCGPNMPVDEDGCCRSCGADATGPGVRRLAVEVARLTRECDEAIDHHKARSARWSEREAVLTSERDEARRLARDALTVAGHDMERMRAERNAALGRVAVLRAGLAAWLGEIPGEDDLVRLRRLEAATVALLAKGES